MHVAQEAAAVEASSARIYVKRRDRAASTFRSLCGVRFMHVAQEAAARGLVE